MRLLHTSDWHLGRSFHGAGLLDDQAAAIDAMVEIVASEGVDAVIVAGDLYDRQIPPADAVTVLSDGLARLREAGAVVVAISGNHDSAVRLGYGDRLLARAGVHVRGDVRSAGTPVVVPATDGGTDVCVYPIPYLEPEVARHHLLTEATHDAVLRGALDRARADLATRGAVRSVAVAHAFAAGGTPCDSERPLRVGGADRVALGCFDGFDYVALGHLHGRQSFADGRMRYSGSPLPYSFSERDHRKGVWLVDLVRDGGVRVTGVDLPVRRGLAVVRGDLDELLRDPQWAAAEPCWVQATLTDPVLPRDAMRRLQHRFPWAASLLHDPPVSAADHRTYRERVAGRDDLQLIGDFLAHVTGAPAGEDDLDVCRQAVQTVHAHDAVTAA
ncbi:MAG TPA: exonuclease SbcCD subunit D [Egibacteraceae bacterium]|nr:exonuclease SbcCD subunit D [Egibacteraceae bacterium]